MHFFSNPLTGPNFMEWKRNLKYVLMAEGCYFALTDPTPPVLTDASTDEEKEEMKRWIKADNIALCYIMTSMSPTLQLQNEGIEPAADVMLNLEELFGSKDHANRSELTKKIVSTWWKVHRLTSMYSVSCTA